MNMERGDTSDDDIAKYLQQADEEHFGQSKHDNHKLSSAGNSKSPREIRTGTRGRRSIRRPRGRPRLIRQVSDTGRTPKRGRKKHHVHEDSPEPMDVDSEPVDSLSIESFPDWALDYLRIYYKIY